MAKLWTSSIGFLLILTFILNLTLSTAQQSRVRDRSRQQVLQKSLLHPSQNNHLRKLTPFLITASISEKFTTPSTSTTKSGVMRGDQTPTDDDDFTDGVDDYDDPDVEDSETPIFYPLGNHKYKNSWETTNTQIYKFRHLGAYHRQHPRVHPCEQSSCYPATGNLLIGRENRLYASSTCGLRRPERFCIVSHLEEKKCFLCDTNRRTQSEPLKNHRVGQIIYKNEPGTLEQSWWQSENGVENVTIQLDLEAEFHFTHLIIVFATFRPSAMLIERSYDFGKNWHVYKYFAHNCRESFPDAPTNAKNITDVVCDRRYSSVEPSKNGEVIYRVLPPNMNIENPYAEHVQNMLKMTNLRVNFTKLHSLGDTLLDDRDEIQEKYYYAISNMIVRGSCSCYGHASRCLPLDGLPSDPNTNKIVDMVHGKCECTHNTKGLNCEECEDFFNDLPWKPALGKQTNACKKCNCNNHATSCHIDMEVYEQSGRVSGGVCDNCQHNTQGQHCEECMPFFYRDPNEDIQSPYVCNPCDCDPKGSLDDGICDSIVDLENGVEAGACHCKTNVKGRRCDTCKDGYWNFEEENPAGCQACSCNILGTIGNSGCNIYTGECTCKRLVTGRDCNQCVPESYGLSEEEEGCKLCNCDPGGSLDNNCDVVTGQCRCRPYMQGRDCSEPKQNHYIPVLHTVIEAEAPFTICDGYTNYGNCSVIIRERSHDYPPTWTGDGFIRVHEGNEVTFTINEIPKTMNYDIVLRYLTQTKGDWEDVRVTIERPDYDPEGPCGNSHPNYERNRPLSLGEYETSAVALYDVCLENGKTYKFKISFQRQNPHEDNPAAYILIDSIVLVPKIEVTPIFTGSIPAETRLREFTQLGCNQTYYDVNYEKTASQECRDLLNTVSIFVFNGAAPCDCNPTGSTTKKCEEHGGYCQCKPNVIGRQCDRCESSYYGFGPEGCKACDCNSIGAKHSECDLVTGQCDCNPNTYGRECDQCQPGFWNFPNCQQCECNGHAQTCDSRTGECTSCQDFTTGYNCDRCVSGFYGDPQLGSEIGCRPCRCPDTIASGHTYATECGLISATNDVYCYCQEGYGGSRCDVCADNYYGNPEKPGGACLKCDCNNNIDVNDIGNCDGKSGKCLKCLHNTEGDNCEYCRDGYYGEAHEQNCRQCECDFLGTNSTVKFCDRFTGQCPCLPNVQGKSCDQCITNHWKIASGEGCEACNCDPIGSDSEQCNPYDGQCSCRPGFGGRQCNQCESDFWGNPNVECKACHCDVYGSAISQCDRETGQCKCNKGIGGYKCDKCARGYLGYAPRCEPCGECFDNWDIILNDLKIQTQNAIEEAKNIKTLGATGAYTKEFEGMKNKIEVIEQLLANTTISTQDITDIQDFVEDLRKHFDSSLEVLQKAEGDLESINSKINLANVGIDGLRNKSELIKQAATELKNNATRLQENNIEGALNLTKEAWHKVNMLSQINEEILDSNVNAQRTCKRTEMLLERNAGDFDRLKKSNEAALENFNQQLDELNAKIPDLNYKMCDKRGDPCDGLCGGAGCDACGGVSCENGAVTRAEKALGYVIDTENNIKKKEQTAEDLFRSMSHAKTNASDAYKVAVLAHRDASSYYNSTVAYVAQGLQLLSNLTEIDNNSTALLEEIQSVADKTLGLVLHLKPEEIKNLARGIDDKVSQLENVDTIIRNTAKDLERVETLKENANNAKERAEDALQSVTTVVSALDEASVAQTKARTAIKQAKDDIDLAKSDLEQIDSETGEALNRATNTAATVDRLTQRLNELQKNFLKNDLDAKDIKAQADAVKNSTSNTHDMATQLSNEYRSVNELLSMKADKSESARERAQSLLQRASKITVDTSSKLSEIQGMVDLYKSNEKELYDLDSKVNRLNNEIAGYLDRIQSHADRYRTCAS